MSEPMIEGRTVSGRRFIWRPRAYQLLAEPSPVEFDRGRANDGPSVDNPADVAHLLREVADELIVIAQGGRG